MSEGAPPAKNAKKPTSKSTRYAQALSQAYARCLWVLPCASCHRLRRLRDVRTVDSQASNDTSNDKGTLVVVRRTTMNPYDAQVLVHMCLGCLRSLNGGRSVE